MTKKLLCAALLAATAFAQAGETTWNYTYTGMVFLNTGFGEPETFMPNAKLGGSFTGEDKNGDGIIAKDELSHFVSAGVTLVGGAGGKCMLGNISEWTCNFSRFSYQVNTKALDYAANYDFPVLLIGAVDIAPGYGSYHDVYDAYFKFNDQTKFTISAVPEPSTALLLPAGLAVVMAARRRRKQAA